ncbi:MAG: RNA polymerase sigma factor [Bacteroidaceae bacterium]|nr:RNA polymerase sigma factor [Bacteroidaceae bacterium]
MLAVCYRYTGNLDDAHDVLHDGFIKIFTHFSFRGDSALKTWMYKVMSSQAIDFVRQKHANSLLLMDSEELPDLPDVNENDVMAEGKGIDEETLMRMVAQLPEGCRMVFNLFVFEDKSHKEIAELLHIKPDTSKSQYRYAKNLLITRIKQFIEHEGER